MKLKDINEWIKCLINPKRETHLRIDSDRETQLLNRMNIVIAFVAGMAVMLLLVDIWLWSIFKGADQIWIIRKDGRPSTNQQVDYHEV